MRRCGLVVWIGVVCGALACTRAVDAGGVGDAGAPTDAADAAGAIDGGGEVDAGEVAMADAPAGDAECTAHAACWRDELPLCVHEACVACTAAPELCSVRSGETPDCDPDSGQCVECLESTGCSDPTRPICDAARSCRACHDGPECAARDAATPGCASGRCVTCTADEHCDAASLLVCDQDTHECRVCQEDVECYRRSGKTLGACLGGVCVECTEEIHCSGTGKPHCDLPTHTCKG